jgi:putative transcriptional regulator
MILNNANAGKGKLLISEPTLLDSYFKRSVIILAEHNESGSVGFILNKRVEFRLSEAIEELKDFNFPLYFGGPVKRDNLFYIHNLGDKIEGSMPIGDGLFWGGNFDTLKELILDGKATEKDVKFFLGYSGWEPEQLNREMQENSWFVSNSTKDLIMKDSDSELWRTVMKKMGTQFALLSNFPDNPSMN